MATEASPATLARSRPPEEAGPATVVRSLRPPVALALQFDGVQDDPSPPPQTVTLPVAAGNSYAVTTDQAWLTATPVQLTTPTPVAVTVSTAGKPAGTYFGTVTARGPSGIVMIAVSLVVTAAIDPTDPGDTATFTGSGWLPGTLVRVIPRLPGVDPPDKREWLAAGDYGLGKRTTVLLDRTVLASRTAGTDSKWTATLPAGPYWAVGVQGGEVRYVSFNA